MNRHDGISGYVQDILDCLTLWFIPMFVKYIYIYNQSLVYLKIIVNMCALQPDHKSDWVYNRDTLQKSFIGSDQVYLF